MARLRRFFHSVASGYAVLAVNIVYTLASVPLALHYLGKEEFGLWAVALQLSGYLGLIDLGMSAALARLLIDHKDRPNDGPYGGMIQTACLVLLVQAAVVLAVGTGISFFLGPLLHVGESFNRTFTLLMILQAVLLAFGFATKIFSQLLYAHHRLDIQNYSQMAQFAVSFAVLWEAFEQGEGVFSLIWASAAATVVGIVTSVWACFRLRLFPASGCWGKPSRSSFRELFSYGANIFFINLGNQLIFASQAVIVTRWMGLDAAATWSVCTRLFMLACQLAWHPIEFSYSLFSEMIARGERAQLHKQFDALVVFTLCLSVVGGTALAVCNQPFVTVWTVGKFAWPPWNDTLLGVWLVLLTLVRCNSYLIQASKQLGFLRHIFFIEGLAFIGLAFIAIQWTGFSGVLFSSILCTTLLSCIYTVWRASAYLSVTPPAAMRVWCLPALKIAAVLIPLGVALGMLTAKFTPVVQLSISGTVMSLAGGILLGRFALDDELKAKVREKLPARLLPVFSAIAG